MTLLVLTSITDMKLEFTLETKPLLLPGVKTIATGFDPTGIDPFTEAVCRSMMSTWSLHESVTYAKGSALSIREYSKFKYF